MSAEPSLSATAWNSGQFVSSPRPRSLMGTMPRSISCGAFFNRRGLRSSIWDTIDRLRRLWRPSSVKGAHAVAVSSYQGGHIEFFRFLDRSSGRAGRGACARVRWRRGHDHKEKKSISCTPTVWPESSVPTTVGNLGLEGMISSDDGA